MGFTSPSPKGWSNPSYTTPEMSLAHLYPMDHSTFDIDDIAMREAASTDHHNSIDENDIVIAVMGLTGAGKSSFINTAAGRTEVVIGDNLNSQTQAVKPIRCIHPDGRRNIVLVDTPGFDDTRLSDAQILKMIANWLKETYRDNIKLTGLLYLHRISANRMAGTPLRNLSVFKDLCGNNSLKYIILVTTMWDEVGDQSVGTKREEELLADFWKDMICFGSRTCRFQGTRESAWEIISRLDLEGSCQKRTPLQIQREMVDRGLPLHETAAAKTLLSSLVQFAGECKKVWGKLRDKARRKASPRDSLGGIRRAALHRSSTIRSNSSRTSWSMVSSTDTSSIASRDSTPLSSPAESTFSGCSFNGRQDTLSATIRVLRIAYQMADIGHIPLLRGIIGMALHVAQLIEEMGGTHHAIAQVMESSGWLLDEITQYAVKSELSRDMKRALSSFQRELSNLQKAVAGISRRGRVARFLLHEADIRTISAFTSSINVVYDKLEVKLAMDNRQAIARLEDQLKGLCNSTALLKCVCGGLAVSNDYDGSQECGYPSSSTSQSS